MIIDRTLSCKTWFGSSVLQIKSVKHYVVGVLGKLVFGSLTLVRPR
jgi:hypothetical protein